jgi:hypothetical protein
MSHSDNAIILCINELAHADAEALSAFAPQGNWHFAIVVQQEVGGQLYGQFNRK